VDEFELIERAFRARAPASHAFTCLPNGDDASVHMCPAGMRVVISTDCSAAGRHWPEDMPLDCAAERAVNAALSDLAAMGAAPAWCWLGVMARNADAFDAMGAGIARALAATDMELAGGDTVCVPLNALAVTVAGLLPEGQAMRRDAARAGDDVWLIGPCGLAARGLEAWRAGCRGGEAVEPFLRIRPLLDEGVSLRQAGVRCCIDVSDGLLADAGHVARASGVGLTIELEKVPGFALLEQESGAAHAARLTLAGGEDYALLFTASPDLRDVLADMACRIGACVADTPGQARALLRGAPVEPVAEGFRHFV